MFPLPPLPDEPFEPPPDESDELEEFEPLPEPSPDEPLFEELEPLSFEFASEFADSFDPLSLSDPESSPLSLPESEVSDELEES